MRYVLALCAILVLVAGCGSKPNPRQGGGLIFPSPTHTVSAPEATALPDHFALRPFVTRVHSQGLSNSCVGQTLAQMMEILESERYYRTHNNSLVGYSTPDFSSGFLWNQATDYSGAPSTYEQEFGIGLRYGASHLRTFTADGHATDYWWQPPGAAYSDASYNKFGWWHYVAPTDRYQIESQITQGHPLGLALHVYDSFYNLFGTNQGQYSSDWGNFRFDHSVTIIGYNAFGVTILNSWGTGWAQGGYLTLSWNYLVERNLVIVAEGPAQNLPMLHLKHHKKHLKHHKKHLKHHRKQHRRVR